MRSFCTCVNRVLGHVADQNSVAKLLVNSLMLIPLSESDIVCKIETLNKIFLKGLFYSSFFVEFQKGQVVHGQKSV